MEPLYTFVKGQGWVIKPPVEEIVTYSLDRKKRLTIQNRTPENGEAFVIPCRDWGLSEAANHCADFNWHNFMPWRASDASNTTRVYAVVIEDV